MIDRRTFFGLFALPRVIVLEAIAAPRMPDIKLILAPGIQAPVFEFRTYLSPPRLDLFAKAGIIPARKSASTYMIPFRSLTERQRAWDALAADPEWRKLPNEPKLTHISIYRSLS
jgi:hypothetical protein